MRVLVNISRYLVGIFFILSGLIKANDPLGFSYKLDEYFQVFHTPWMSAISLGLAIFICVLEIILGVALILGFKSNMTAWLLLLLIVFFTWLTGYSAVTGKVTDCGCFGDALHLTPYTSFYKDLVLLVFILIIFFNRHKIHPLFSNRGVNTLMVLSTILFTGFSLFCYFHLPVVDFRPFAKGKNILKGMEVPEGAPRDEFKTVLTYEKGGVVKEFTPENYPWQDSTWVWKDTKSVLVKAGYHAPIHDFVLRDAEGNDHTQEVLNYPGYTFLLVSYDVTKANKGVMLKINDFAQQCEKANIRFLGLSGSTIQATDLFRHDVNAMFDFYFCDAIPLKTMIRSNPGLMLIKNATVIDMWHYNDLPGFNKVNEKYTLVGK